MLVFGDEEELKGIVRVEEDEVEGEGEEGPLGSVRASSFRMRLCIAFVFSLSICIDLLFAGC